MNQLAFCLMLELLLQLCTSTQVQVVPGSTLQLPCFQFPPNLPAMPISWKFNGNNITSRDSVTTSATHLSISPVIAADQGEYECSVMDPETNVEMRRTYNVVIEALITYTLVVGDGTDARLPCNFLSEYEVKANALWFKETASNKKKAMLTSADKNEEVRAKLLYPNDHDQTMSLREVTTDDEGLYHCESPEGVLLSTVRLIVNLAPIPTPHSCQGLTAPWEACEDDHSRVAGSVFRESLTEFSFKLYSFFRESRPQKNLLYSPISINGALTHLLLGARSKTRLDLESALCLPSMFHCVHSEMKRLREQLSYSSLQMASQIYYNNQYNISESFQTQSAEFYESEPVKLQDNSEDNTHMINNWVANKTKIKSHNCEGQVLFFYDLLFCSSMMFFFNHILLGMWTVKFNEKPMKGHFTKLNGDMIPVPVLQNDGFLGSLAYVTGLKATVMRFGLTGNNSLYILLPQTYKASDLQQVESQLTDAAVRQMVDQVNSATPQGIEVTLPQIKLSVEQDMTVLMKKLGLFSLFESPNLCGLYAEKPLILDEAKHKAYLALTEKGVEAAAVTALGFSRSFPSFSALRPFILLLWNDAAQVPLFIGRVIEP
uniref:Serpin peptidase inhibitor, clade G (C1 inhibitor), member 1 n=1 Tax=Neogobius melanostomus TaxID=47308 RepID=A0A8C6TZ50_9GOBI